MSDTDNKPDLNEDSNVLEAHEGLEASSATSRENHLRENGMEPVSLWVILAIGFAIMVGGAVIGKGGAFKADSLDQYVLPGYVQGLPPGGIPHKLEPMPAMDLLVKNGGKIYQAKCQGCHQPTGLGDGANFPPLGGSEWVTGENTLALSQIIMNGAMGPIEVAGRTWNGVMPAQASGMTQEDLAGVMTYIRNSFGNSTGDVISFEQAGNAIAVYKERNSPAPITVEELAGKYMIKLEGAVMDPSTKINPETLEIVE